MSFIENHIDRCSDILSGKQADSIGPLIQKMRKVVRSQDEAKRPALLKQIAQRERKPFSEAAAAAIDRNLPALPDGSAASALKVNRNLLDFVSLVSPNIRLRARAGSGKSTALVIKTDFLINALGVAPEEIQILTFNKAAANDLKGKLEAALGEPGTRVGVNTFHSLAYAVLKTFPGTRRLELDFADEAVGQPGELSKIEEAVLENTPKADVELYRSMFLASSFKFVATQSGFREDLEGFLASAVTLYRARKGTLPEPQHTTTIQHLERIAKDYELKIAGSDKLDSEAGLRRAAEILSGDPEIPRFTRLNGNLRFLFVDEYQDFSAAFERLTAGVMHRNPDCVLNVVGDDGQSINSFMGADLSFFTGFRKRYEASLNLPLQTNWRCGRQIVELGNAVLGLSDSEKAIAGLPHEGDIRVKTGGIRSENRKSEEWQEDAREFLDEWVSRMAKQAWESDRENGKEPGSLVLLASKNKPFGRALSSYARKIDAPDGVKVEVCTSHASKGREWDHVILLDGIDKAYPSGHPAHIITRDMVSKSDMRAEGRRLLYVAVTRAKHSLAILAPTKINENLIAARKMAHKKPEVA